MKTVWVLLKTGRSVSFANAGVQQRQDGQIVIYDESYRIMAEFREGEIKKWWYDENPESALAGEQ